MHKIKSYIIMLCCLVLLYGCGEDNQPPAKPEVVEPERGSVVSLEVTLRWICEDPDGDMLTYDVYLSNEQIIEAYKSALGARVSKGQIATWYKPKSFLHHATTYTWSVIARDSEGHRSPPLSSTFTTEEGLIDG